MDNLKKGLIYLAYLIVLLLFMWSIHILNNQVYYTFNHTYEFPVGKYLMLYAVSVGLGVTLSFPSLMNKIKEPGKWCINILKLIVLGFPLLVFSLFTFAYADLESQFTAVFNHIYVNGPYDFMHMILRSTTIIQIVLGFILPSCFFKKLK